MSKAIVHVFVFVCVCVSLSLYLSCGHGIMSIAIVWWYVRGFPESIWKSYLWRWFSQRLSSQIQISESYWYIVLIVIYLKLIILRWSSKVFWHLLSHSAFKCLCCTSTIFCKKEKSISKTNISTRWFFDGNEHLLDALYLRPDYQNCERS